MSNSIGRIRTVAIAKQPDFNVEAAAPVYTLPLLDAPSVEPIVNKIKNTSALGSSYRNNDIVNSTRMSSIPLNVKIDEDHLPLLFSQRFSITTTTAAGETTVYQHTLTYTNQTNNWFTLFLQDDNRTDYIMKNVLFGPMNFTADQEFFRGELDAAGTMITAGSFTNTIVQPKEFVGRHATFSVADFGNTLTAAQTLSIALNHDFGRTGDDVNFSLGEANGDLTTHLLTDDEFQTEVTLLEADRTFLDEFVANQKKSWQVQLVSTDRFVNGSVANTRPSMTFGYPVGFHELWTEEAPLDTLVQETITLTATDEVGVTNAPMTLQVVNAITGY